MTKPSKAKATAKVQKKPIKAGSTHSRRIGGFLNAKIVASKKRRK